MRRPVVRCSIVVDTPEDEVVAVPSRAAVPTLVIKPPSLVLPPFQAVAPPMLLVLVKLALGLSPPLFLQARGHRR